MRKCIMEPKMQPKNAPQPEVIIVENDADEVACDGGGGAQGHPKVWYSFDGCDVAECGYCDRAFVKERALATFKAH